MAEAKRLEQQDQQALMRSVDASLEARKPFKTKVALVENYVDSRVEEDATLKAKYLVQLGIPDEQVPRHPRILRAPYPTIAEVERSIGPADSLRPDKLPSGPFLPTECVLPWHVWHIKDPRCIAEHNGKDSEHQCDLILLHAAFGNDRRLCYLQTYKRGDEGIGRSGREWSFQADGSDQYYPPFQ